MLLVAVGIVWWVGPQLVWLTFFESRSDRPYALMQFSQGEASLTARFRDPFAGLVLSEGGETLAKFPTHHLMEGRRADEWDGLGVHKLPGGRALVQVLTSSPYRLMVDQQENMSLLQLGSAQLPLHEDIRPALVVWLVEARPSTTLDPLSGVLANVPGSGGRVVWDVAPDVVNSSIEWDRLLLIDFADVPTALSWLRSTDLRVERAVTRSRAHSMALGVYGR